MIHDAADIVGKLERVVALAGGADVDDHARPVLRVHDARDVLREEVLGDALGQNGRQAERVLDVRQVVDLVGHRLFGQAAVERDERDHHVALAVGGVHLLLGLIDRRAGGVRDRFVAVGEVRHALRDVARDDDEQHEDEQRTADAVGEIAHAAALLREERTVLRFGNDVLKAQDERRHEQQHSDQADGDALGEDNAHVRADAEVHQTHRREADDRRHAGGENGRERAAPCVRHGLLRLDALRALLRERVQQEDRIVHRAGELEHRADRVGQE